jgi:hypothetical protein
MVAMMRGLYVAAYLPPWPIGFVKSADQLIEETENHFGIWTTLALDDEHTMLLAETRRA